MTKNQLDNFLIGRTGNLTVDHISEGKQMDCSACPVALLLNQMLKSLIDTKVILCVKAYRGRAMGVVISKGLTQEVFSMLYSPQVHRWVLDFDNGKEVSPFTLRIVEGANNPYSQYTLEMEGGETQ